MLLPINVIPAHKFPMIDTRLRQLRVRNDSCAVHEDFQKAIRVCYDTYSEDIEDKEPFGNGYRKHTSADASVYKYAIELYPISIYYLSSNSIM